MLRQNSWWFLAAFAAVALCGCDREPPVYRVHGAVTTESGKPAKAGMVYFDPEVNVTEGGVQGFAYIKDGKFDTNDDGRGVSGGKYVARVKVFDGTPKKELPLGEPLGPEESYSLEFPTGESEQKLHLKGS